jgi:hypothetical protein
VTLIPDPAGVLESDAHRRVLAHLSTPDSDYGWTIEALSTSRMAGDYSLHHQRVPEGETAPAPADVLAEILAWAVSGGYAEQSAAGAYRQTPAGHELLSTPPLDPGTPGPANIDSHTAASGAATAWEA